jgi:hypothetical protein
MASAPATVKYRLPSGGNLGDIKVGRKLVNAKQFLNWTQTKTPETATQTRQKAADRLKKTRPLAALTKKNANSLHSNDMRRLGATPPVGPPIGKKEVTSMQQLGSPITNASGKKTGKFEWNRGENVFAENPRLTEASVYVRNSKNKTVLAKGASAPQNGRPGPRPARGSAELPNWKSQAVEYNGALSRQQMLYPGNTVLAAKKPIRVSTKDMAEIPVVKMYASRGGQLGTSTTFANKLPRAAKPSTQIV